MAKWWKKVWCWLTGGHRYSDFTMVCRYNSLTGEYIFRNRCEKCGKPIERKFVAEHVLPVMLRKPYREDRR